MRILGTRRGTAWGYSLFSFEVYGDSVVQSGGVAVHQPVVSSSVFSASFAASRAVDGDPSTRWSSAFSDPQWIYVDVGQPFILNGVRLVWRRRSVLISIFSSGTTRRTGTTVASVTGNAGGTNDVPISGTGRYVRVYGTRRGTEWGYSLFSFEVVRRGRFVRISRH